MSSRVSTASREAQRNWRSCPATYLALSIVLVLYPGFRMAVSYLDLFADASGREGWWSLWSVVLVGHWMCAAIVLAAVASERGSFSSLGLDLGAFVRRRRLLLTLLFAVCVVAYLAPGYLYADGLPDRMQSHPLGPVTSAQRIFWVAMAVTAGFVEELLYRGYAVTRLRRRFGLPIAVVLPIVAFALMHGPSVFEPRLLALYLVSGALFTAMFLLWRCTRLELLMMTHAALDLLLVAAP